LTGLIGLRMNADSGISIGDGLGGEPEAELLFELPAVVPRRLVLDGLCALKMRLFFALAAVSPLAEVQMEAVSLPLPGRDMYVGGRDKDI